MKAHLSLASVLVIMAAPALSAHANPWATETDVVLSEQHDANQARSVDTPGEDEMRGRMVRSAKGKTGGTSGASSSSTGSAGAGGGGHGRN